MGSILCSLFRSDLARSRRYSVRMRLDSGLGSLACFLELAWPLSLSLAANSRRVWCACFDTVPSAVATRGLRQFLRVLSGGIKRMWHSWGRMDRSNVVVVVVVVLVVYASVVPTVPGGRWTSLLATCCRRDSPATSDSLTGDPCPFQGSNLNSHSHSLVFARKASQDQISPQFILFYAVREDCLHEDVRG